MEGDPALHMTVIQIEVDDEFSCLSLFASSCSLKPCEMLNVNYCELRAVAQRERLIIAKVNKIDRWIKMNDVLRLLVIWSLILDILIVFLMRTGGYSLPWRRGQFEKSFDAPSKVG
jgi:hypothetical protein